MVKIPTDGIKGYLKKIIKGKIVPSPTRDYTPEELAVYNAFGSKFSGDAKRLKKVTEAAASGLAVSRKLKDPNASRAKVDPLVYRKMEEDKGSQAVIDAVNAGDHLRRTEAGYTGGPRTITGPRDLAVMRGGVDKTLEEATTAIRLADPENAGNWYNNAVAGQAAMNEPYQLPRSLEQHGVFSAGVPPSSEIAFALKHHNSRALGVPMQAARPKQMEVLDLAVDRGLPSKLGRKTGVYAGKQDPRAPVNSLFGTNDFRHAQYLGFTHPDGSPWRQGLEANMHPFADAETALIVDRANKNMLGGASNWSGNKVQEIPWVYGKAQDLYSRGIGKSGKYKGDPIEGMKAAIREANKSPADYLPNHAISATYEYAPGASTGHMPSYWSMTPEERIAYGNEGRWDVESPEVEMSNKGLLPATPGGVGQGRRDVIHSAMGFRQLPTIPSRGAYRNAAGEWENNDMFMSRPLGDYPTGGGEGYLAKLTGDTILGGERFRGLVDGQEAGAANLPNTLSSLKGKNAALLDAGAVRANAAPQPTSEQLQNLNKALGPISETDLSPDALKYYNRRLASGPPTLTNSLGDLSSIYGAGATNRGAAVFPFDRGADAKDFRNLLSVRGDLLQNAMPNAKLTKGKNSSVFAPALTKFDENYNLIPTKPFSGEATSAVLNDFAVLPHRVSLNLSESPAVRSSLAAKVTRDERIGGAREDIQNTRRFFRDADWPKAVELMRKGVPVGTALATLGYSLSAMASPTDKGK